MRRVALAVPVAAVALALSGGLPVRLPPAGRPRPAAATGSVPETATAVADVLDHHGIGPVRLGMSKEQLLANGYVARLDEPGCGDYETTERGTLLEVWLVTADHATRDGVGMTVAEVQRVYADRVTVDTREGDGPFEALTVRDAGTDRELLFLIDWDQQPLSADDTVGAIVACTYSREG